MFLFILHDIFRCRNSLPCVLLSTLIVGLMSARLVQAGSLASPAAPTNPASAMFTLEDIYQKLDNQGTTVTKRTGAFTEPADIPTNGTMHTLDDIMALVTNRAPASKTGQVISYQIGDDGTNHVGVASPNPRFTIDATGTNVIDNLTGLMWTKNANIAVGTVWSVDGTVTWSNAFEVIHNMSSGVVNRVNYGGYNDWRLPNIMELESLIDYSKISPALPAGHPFDVLAGGNYWSSSAYKPIGGTYSWYLPLSPGGMNKSARTSTYYVWPVRGGQK